MRLIATSIPAFLVAAFVASGAIAQTGSPGSAHAAASPSREVKLQLDMRKLWEDHITWTRNYIISAIADLPDLDTAAKRLLKNQDDIGDAAGSFYGTEAGSKLAALLRDHIMIATEVVKAAKAGNNDQVQTAQQKWSANAKDIATFLSGANPNWSRRELEDMLQKHLDFTTTEAVSRLKQDWAADIKAYDDNHVHMLMFSDLLTNGIIEQFPAKFRGRASSQAQTSGRVIRQPRSATGSSGREPRSTTGSSGRGSRTAPRQQSH
jgi:hypothetical protein